MLKFNDYIKEAKLSAKQKKIAAIAGDKDKIDADDLAALRAGKKPVEEASCDGKYMKKEELVGKQHKLDKNHNGKLDAQDFKMLRKEEVELTEELHKDFHDEVQKHFPKNSDNMYGNHEIERGPEKNTHELKSAKEAHAAGNAKKMHKHLENYYEHSYNYHDYHGDKENAKEAEDLSIHHMKLAGKKHVKEETEQIDELKASTLLSYIPKAAKSGDEADKERHAEYKKYDNTGDKKHSDAGNSLGKKFSKRRAGISRALDSLKKKNTISGISDRNRMNEAEQIDELSKDTLNSYVKGAATDLPRYGNTLGRLQTHGKLKHVEKSIGKSITNRHRGIARAVDKLTKEETVEEAMCKHEVEKSFPASGVKTGASAPKGTTYMPKDKQKAKGKPAGALGEETLDEGRVKELAMDLKDMSHDEFHKQYGKPKSHFDSTNFKKPVEPGKGMDRAKALAQRGMQSLSKEEVERIEEKLAQLDELSPATLKSYKKGIYRDLDRAADAYPHGTGDDDEDRKLNNRVKGDELADKKLKAKGVNPYSEEVEQIDELSGKTLGSYHQKARKDVRARASDLLWQYGVHHGRDIEDAASEDEWDKDTKADAKKDLAKRKQRDKGIDLAAKKLAKKATANEEVSAEMSPYLKGTLAVMDEGKIDNLRDAQKLRQDMQSAYDKDYKPDTSHPHIQVVKGSAYGGANQKDDEGDEKPDETKEKKGRGRPTGSKSGARQKGGGHEDGGIPVHNLNLPKSYK